jgi:predicted ATPase
MAQTQEHALARCEVISDPEQLAKIVFKVTLPQVDGSSASAGASH